MERLKSELKLVPEQRSCEVPPGTSLQEALALLDLHVTAPCGGEGSCGKCRIEVLEGGVEPLSAAERVLLSPAQIEEGVRLSCQARICGSAQVAVPAASRTAAIRPTSFFSVPGVST